MSNSIQIEGTVVSAIRTQATIETDDGKHLEAIVSKHWFSTKGPFDLCPGIPIGTRVLVTLRTPPEPHRVSEIVKA